MGFYYATERKRFEQEWNKLRKEYEAAGMTSETIQLLYEFDLEFFRSQRTYENHTQVMPNEYIGDKESSHSSLFRKFAISTVTFDEADFSDRYSWIYTIENQNLLQSLCKLSEDDLELLTLYAIEGFTQSQIAKRLGCNQSVVSKKLKRIKIFLK